MTRTTPTNSCTTYEIRVAGHLDDHWSTMVGDLALARLDDGTTTLTGPIVDQAQLHGVLAGVRDLGVPLLSLRVVDGVDTETPDAGRMPATSQVEARDLRP